MSSTNKTPYLKLNSWLGSDIPCRADFVMDNDLIDSSIEKHFNDVNSHVTTQEKYKWNNTIYTQGYTGVGGEFKTIELNCNVVPKWGFVYAIDYPTVVTDFLNKTTYHYFGFFNQNITNNGFDFKGKTLTVKNMYCPFFESEMYSFNKNGAHYMIVAFM